MLGHGNSIVDFAAREIMGWTMSLRIGDSSDTNNWVVPNPEAKKDEPKFRFVTSKSWNPLASLTDDATVLEVVNNKGGPLLDAFNKAIWEMWSRRVRGNSKLPKFGRQATLRIMSKYEVGDWTRAAVVAAKQIKPRTRQSRRRAILIRQDRKVNTRVG